ncbi:MAG: HEAT repeat domain-containing protein [Desulfovibrio sp.]
MAKLDNFREKDFLDQVALLNEVAGSKDKGELDHLMALFRDPMDDTTLDYLVVNALNAILSEDEELIVSGIKSDDEALRTLCVRVAGEYGFLSSIEAIEALYKQEEDVDARIEQLTVLASFDEESTLPIFREAIYSKDEYEAALAIETLGRLNDTESIDLLKKLVTENNEDDTYEQCEITTWKAIEAMAMIESDQTLAFLAEHLHHKNPTARRIITDTMSSLGEKIVPHLEKILEKDNVDDKLLAANIIGFIGHKKGGDALVHALDRKLLEDENAKYAAYEALGRIGTMKCIICLVDGLAEPDDFILIAVVTALEKHVNPGILKSVSKLLHGTKDQAIRLAKAIVAAKAVRLFTALYPDEEISNALMDVLVESKDAEVIEAFHATLADMDTERADNDMARLPFAAEPTRYALAADDSRSMLALHRAILADMGFEPIAVSNGEEAYELIEEGADFDIIITDMNMPVMDGMEFVERLRYTEGCEDVPVIMVTTESEGSQQELARKAGVDAFVTKPFKPDQLKSTIRELLGE